MVGINFSVHYSYFDYVLISGSITTSIAKSDLHCLFLTFFIHPLSLLYLRFLFNFFYSYNQLLVHSVMCFATYISMGVLLPRCLGLSTSELLPQINRISKASGPMAPLQAMFQFNFSKNFRGILSLDLQEYMSTFILLCLLQQDNIKKLNAAIVTFVLVFTFTSIFLCFFQSYLERGHFP